MASPAVSALVSAYYAAPYIVARLENLLRQEPRPEVIVICQQDGEEHNVARLYPVQIVTTDDIPTLYKAWNMGINHAHGEYLTSANSDDLLYPGALAAMVAELERTGAAICHGEMDIKKPDDTVMSWNRGTGDLMRLKRSCFIGPMPMWRMCLHYVYGMFDETYTIAGDYDFWLRCVSKGEKICYLPRPLGLYWQRSDSLEHKDSAKHTQERKRVKEQYG
jgi:glycosyltransferase involved in cell wall biosynthesis